MFDVEIVGPPPKTRKARKSLKVQIDESLKANEYLRATLAEQSKTIDEQRRVIGEAQRARDAAVRATSADALSLQIKVLTQQIEYSNGTNQEATARNLMLKRVLRGFADSL